jgi:preprotein translocase subunit SecG
MANVLIVAYLLIVLALIAVILLQRSEGGGLGMGSSSNGLISVRGSANLLTRTTTILAALFFATAIGLTILARLDKPAVIDKVVEQQSGDKTVLDAIQQLQTERSGTDATTPATPAAPAADPGVPVPAAPAATDAGAATTPAETK